MKQKLLAFLTGLVLVLTASAGLAYAKGDNSGSGGSSGGNSGHGGRGEEENRVRVEVRTGQVEPEENRVRVEIRGEGATVENALELLNQQTLPDEIGRVRIEQRDDRVRVEVRGPEVEEEVEAPGVEIENDQFEITGEVTAVSAGSFVVAGRTVMINPGQVNGFEQVGPLELGAMVKVEGPVIGQELVAREIKNLAFEEAEDEVEVENEVEEENMMTSFLNQILAFFQSLM